MKTEHELYLEAMLNGPRKKTEEFVDRMEDLIDDPSVENLISRLQELVNTYGPGLVCVVDYNYDETVIKIWNRTYETPKEQEARCKKEAKLRYDILREKEDKKLAKQKKAEDKERELYEKLRSKYER